MCLLFECVCYFPYLDFFSYNMPIFVLPLHPKSEVNLKIWRIYLLLLACGVVLGGRALADSHDADREVVTTLVVGQAFSSAVALPYEACEQTSSIDVSGPVNISFSLNIKDYHNYIDDPFTRNRRIELQAVSYLYYNKAFPSSYDLSSLQRLNV